MLHIPDILSASEVADLRARLDAAAWEDGRASVGAQGALVKDNHQLTDRSDIGRELGERVRAALARNPVFFAAALPQRMCPPMFNRYTGGGHYGFHVDGSVRALPDGSHMRTDLSLTLFLTDPDDYEGGELIVADTYGQHEVKLPAGDLILYPSTSLHRVAPVTRGARVCAVLWTQSMVRDDMRRTMLFDLDQTITRLRGHGEDENTLALTNHYHNLLRLWTEV